MDYTYRHVCQVACGMDSSDFCRNDTPLDLWSSIPRHWSFAQNSHWILPAQSVTSLSWLLRCLFLVFNSPFLVLHFSCLLVNSLIYGDDSFQSVAVNHSEFGEIQIQLSRQEESPHGYHLPMIDEMIKVTFLLMKTWWRSYCCRCNPQSSRIPNHGWELPSCSRDESARFRLKVLLTVGILSISLAESYKRL